MKWQIARTIIFAILTSAMLGCSGAPTNDDSALRESYVTKLEDRGYTRNQALCITNRLTTIYKNDLQQINLDQESTGEAGRAIRTFTRDCTKEMRR